MFALLLLGPQQLGGNSPGKGMPRSRHTLLLEGSGQAECGHPRTSLSQENCLHVGKVVLAMDLGIPKEKIQSV